MKPVVFDAEVILNSPVNDSVFLMRLHAEAFSGSIIPGQFVMVQTSEECFPLLRRPFSVCGVGNNCIDMLFQIKGIGTRHMSRLRVGDKISIMGPLGRGFDLPEGTEKVYIIAGGIGIAPVLFLMNRLSNSAITVDAFIGAETESKVLKPERFGIKNISVNFATDDGSIGYKGLVTELFNNYIERTGGLPDIENSCICSCGPLPMLKSVSFLAEKLNIKCYVSVESRMACGTGACLGCVVEVNSTREKNSFHERVCIEGPVFDAKHINLNRLLF